jgi:hypothetical protein
MIIVTIRKPLYGTFCNIRESVINNAIKSGQMMLVKIPQGEAVVDPGDWKKTGKRVEQVFNFPDNPMVMWGNYVPIDGVSKTQDIVEGQMELI